MKLESGTCIVCSAPCSSCMHLNRTLMGSKAQESSDENCRLEGANKYSIDDDDVSSLRSRACESLQQAVSENSNMLSVNSSQDTLSENAESRQASSNIYQNSKYSECRDDSTFCISRASDVNLVNNGHQRNAERVNTSSSSASVSRLGAEGSGSTPSVDMTGLPDIPSFKDADTGRSSPKLGSHHEQSQSGKSLSSIPSLTHLERDSIENFDPSLTKDRALVVVSADKSVAEKDSLIGNTANGSLRTCPKSEADTCNDVVAATNDDQKCSVHDGQLEKAEEMVKSSGMQEPQSEYESDESDVVEHDVKVCDICGDAGREDLLAICSRCSDGAEHTYCMRVMLQKVPEGDWLCEECKYTEETENKKMDVEEKKVHKVCSTSQVSGKRLSENIEEAEVPASKRQALESSTGSPKLASPKRSVPLSRESSFKNLDKVKVKPGSQMPIHNHSGGDDTDIARPSSTGHGDQTLKSTLLKSSSFNNLNSNPRVKLFDEVVPQKQKGVGERTSMNVETPTRMIDRSMSFKSSSLGRSSATESKVKMLSPKSATAQELKGTKHLKQLGSFDRKLLPRIDRPVVCSTTASSVVSTPKGDQKLTPRGETTPKGDQKLTPRGEITPKGDQKLTPRGEITPKGDQKLTPRGETTKHSAVNNNRELKSKQDGKSVSLSRSTSHLSRKSSEAQVCSERTSTSVDEALQDVVPRSRETANQVEKTVDYSSDRVRPCINTATKNPFCPKCKEFGHPPECCAIGSTQESRAEASATASSSLKEDVHNGNRLKAAIQAALLRRPEIYKKKEVPSQTDDFSASVTDLNCEVALQDRVLVSNTSMNSISAEEVHEHHVMLENSESEMSKSLSADDLRQHNFCPTDVCSQLRKPDSTGLAAGKHIARDLLDKVLAISSVFSKTLAIPEYEYIWQGVFEVRRSGKAPDLCTGIQAHLSTCASPKVLEVVKKFLPRVPLNEVSRLSTWPSQFHPCGPREDNIALYFFAKDIESYERHYKGLVDHMIRNDLALKGIFDGVELLIFPSNQLSENSQRWNMLFFLWGVFRGRRINHSDSAKKICIPSFNAMPIEKDIPTAVVTFSETHCSPKRVDEESIACDKAFTEILPSTSEDQGPTRLSRNVDVQEANFEQTPLSSQANFEKPDTRIDTKSTSDDLTSSTHLCQEMKSTGWFLKSSVQEHGQYSQSRLPEGMTTGVSSSSISIVETKTDSDISVKQENTLSSGIASVGNQERGPATNISKDKILDVMKDDEDLQRPKRKQEDVCYIDLEATYQEEPTVEGVNCQLPSDKEVRYVDLTDTDSHAASAGCQKMPWTEVNGKLEYGEISCKKLKTGFSEIYGCCSSGASNPFNGSFTSLANGFGSCSSVDDRGCKEACDEKIIREDFGTMERTFFPVDLNGTSLKGSDEYEVEVQDRIPNLELGLGNEAKPPPPKGMLPFLIGPLDRKNNQEKSPDLIDEKEDDGDAASLSLSLSFPSSKEEHVKPASKAELLPDGHRVNTSFLLFGRFTDK